jgi:hypothetical protein
MNDEARMTSDLARPNVPVPSVVAAAGLRHSRAPFFPKGVRVIRLNPTESDRLIFVRAARATFGVLPPAARALGAGRVWGWPCLKVPTAWGPCGRPPVASAFAALWRDGARQTPPLRVCRRWKKQRLTVNNSLKQSNRDLEHFWQCARPGHFSLEERGGSWKMDGQFVKPCRRDR